MEELKNTGVIIVQPEATDFMVGALEYKEICSDWTNFLPSTERQYTRYADTMACVSFSAMNTLETQINYLYASNTLQKADKEFLDTNGYIVNGKCNLSDRFIAKMSGTTNQGNSMNKVWQTIRECGVIPESDWAFNDNFTWEEYYAEIPQELKDKGKKFLERFIINYEWVLTGTQDRNTQQTTLQKQSKQAPIQIASFPIQGSNPVADKGCGSTHATIIHRVDDKYRVFDHYEPFNFNGNLDFCIMWAMKGLITPKAGINVDISQYEGKVIEAPNGKAYLIQEGKKRWSPDLTTFFAHNLKTSDIIKVSQQVADAITSGNQMQFSEAPLKDLFLDMKKNNYVSW